MAVEYPKIKVFNKNLMWVYTSANSKIIEPNIFEVVKAYCIAAETNKIHKDFLPYSNGVLDYYYENALPDLFKWYYALTSDNHPRKVDFHTNPQKYLEFVLPLDFSRPFDEELTASIRSHFLVKTHERPINTDISDADMPVEE